MEKLESARYVGKLVRVMVEALVDDAGEISIAENFDDGQILILDVWVAPGDRGKVVGRNGHTARSIRAIAGAAARKHEIRLDLNIIEEEVETGKIATR